MKRSIFNHFLFAPAETGKPSAGGPAPASTTSPENPGEGGDGDDGEGDGDEAGGDADADDPSPSNPEAGSPKKIGAIDRAKLHLKGKGFLINQLAAAYDENATLRARVASLEAEARDSKSREEKTAGKLQQAEQEKTTVSKEVRKELTSLGVSEKDAPSQVGADQTPEALLEKFNSLKGSAKIAFFRQHEKTLLAAEAASKK